MRLPIIFTLLRKDIEDTYRSRRILFSTIGFPLFMGIIFPTFIIVSSLIDSSNPDEDIKDLARLFQLFPYFARTYGHLPVEHQAIVLSVFLIVFFVFLLIPTSLPLFVAADSIAGEKERKTLEVMLAAPITTAEYVLGKVFAAWLPSLVVTLLIALLQVAWIDFITYPVLKFMLLPDFIYLLLVFLVSPIAGLLAVTITTFISSRSSTVREAEQLSGFGVLLVYPLVGGQIILFLLEPLYAVGIAVMALLLALIFLKISIEAFEGESILRKL